MTAETFVTMANKTFEKEDKVLAKVIHVTSLAKYIRRFGRQRKTKMIGGKVLSIYSKNPASGHNSRYVRCEFDLGGGATKVADVNIRSILVAPEEKATL